MTRAQQARIVLIVGMMVMSVVAASTKLQPQPSAYGREAPSVFDGVLGNGAGSPEMSTAELKAALKEGGAIVLDARPYEEYAVSHIPTARAVPAKAGTTPALYVGDAAEVAKTIPDQTQPLILYCNGLFCGRSERLAAKGSIPRCEGAASDLPPPSRRSTPRSHPARAAAAMPAFPPA